MASGRRSPTEKKGHIDPNQAFFNRETDSRAERDRLEHSESRKAGSPEGEINLRGGPHMSCCQPHQACCCAHKLRGGHHKACCHVQVLTGLKPHACCHYVEAVRERSLTWRVSPTVPCSRADRHAFRPKDQTRQRSFPPSRKREAFFQIPRQRCR